MANTSSTSDGRHDVAAALGPSEARRTGDGPRTGKVFPSGEGGKEPRNRQQRRGGKVPRRQLAGTGANRPLPAVARPRRRRRPGEAALAEIRLQQKSTGLIISKAAMSRLVREITQSIPGHKTDLRWTVHALEAIHEAVEAYAVQLFERSNLCAIHGKRVTIQPKDMDLVLKVREE